MVIVNISQALPAFLSAALLVWVAAPAHASTILFQDTDLTGGDITTTLPLGASDPLSGVVNAPFNALTVFGAAANNGSYAPLYLLENFDSSTDILTLSGTINGCPTCGNLPGLQTDTNLVTIQFSADLLGDTSGASGSAFVLEMPVSADITSVTVAPALLADLGLTGTAFQLTGLELAGQAVSAQGNNFVVVENGSIQLSSDDPPAATPEPATWPIALLGLGLVMVACRASNRAKLV